MHHKKAINYRPISRQNGTINYKSNVQKNRAQKRVHNSTVTDTLVDMEINQHCRLIW